MSQGIRDLICLALSVLALLALSCSDKPNEPETVKASLNGPFTLGIGKTAEFTDANLSIRFEFFEFDDRCCDACFCSWEGIAGAEFLVEAGDESDSLFLFISGVPDDEDISKLTCEKSGYEFSLLELLPEGFYSSSIAAGEATIAPAPGEAKLIVRQAQQLDTLSGKVELTDLDPQAIQLGEFTLAEATITDDLLALDLTYAGGCRPHYFWAYMSPSSFGDGTPRAANIYFRHADYDPCEALVTERVYFDLSLIKAAYFTAYGQLDPIKLNIFDYYENQPGDKIELIYGLGDTEWNHPPEISPIGDQEVHLPNLLEFTLSASDADSDPITWLAEGLPVDATLTDNGDGSATFVLQTSLSYQTGTYSVTFIASDGYEADTLQVEIEVLEAINQPPVFGPLPGDTAIYVGQTLELTISATDPEGATPAFSVQNLPDNASFVDNSDGTASFSFAPILSQLGEYTVAFVASDGDVASMTVLEIVVLNPSELIVFEIGTHVDIPPGEGYVTWINASAAAGTEVEIGILEANTDQYEFAMDSPGQATLSVAPRCATDEDWVFSFAAWNDLDADTTMFTISTLDYSIVQWPSLTVALTAGSSVEHAFYSNYSNDLSRWPIFISANSDLDVTLVDEDKGQIVFEISAGATDLGEHFVEVTVGNEVCSDLRSTDSYRVVVNELQQNSGEMLPLAVGNYWVYEAEYDAFYDGGMSGLREWNTSVSLDSVEVVDSEVIEGDTWWTLSKPLWPFGDRLMVRGDSVFSDFFKDIGLANGVPNSQAACVAGSFSAASQFEFYDFSPHDPGRGSTYEFTLASGIGLISGSQADYPGFPMSCDQFGCTTHYLHRTLIRYNINSE